MGKPGRKALTDLLPGLVEEFEATFVICNAENVAGGFGITPTLAEQVLGVGVDVLTTGNHVYAKKEIEDYLETTERVLRPANMPPGALGHGYAAFPDALGRTVGVLNLQGVVFMQPIDCPFRRGMEIIRELRETTPILIVDFHAEATAEKIAFAHYVDGLCSAVVGTHTHVQTADETVLPGGTALISDLGMTGPIHSVIGMDADIVIDKFVRKMPRRFDVADGPSALCGAVVEVDPTSGRALSIQRVRREVEA